MKLKCDCHTHILDIADYSCGKTKGISISIYDIYSPKSGRKYKKPKLLADAVIMNSAYPKELDKLLKFLKKYYE